ncbi:MAG: hypothetical protein JXJ17_07435 [Anaerolineae bacterium]|nr:hypothetical protein [Anaerolineae bacterium]
MVAQPAQNDDRIQALANILSLLAIIGGMDKAAVQRVLISLGSNLIAGTGAGRIEMDLAARLLAQVANEDGEEAALRIASDMGFVAKAWKPVLIEFTSSDPYRIVPSAEIIYQLVNYSSFTLQSYGAFERFGGPDQVISMPQLTASLKPYPVPDTGLIWELVGFSDPPDQALVGTSMDAMYLFKAASSNVDLRFSELERNADSDARQEHDVRIDDGLFAAFIAGLLGDLLYWAARLRADAITGQQTWRRIKALIIAPEADVQQDTDSNPDDFEQFSG